MALSNSGLLDSLIDMNEYEFEQFIADLWNLQGWSTTVTSGSNDRGVDIIAKQDSPYNQKNIIQAKKYSRGNNVSSPEVQQYSSLRRQFDDVDAIIIVTTSDFTNQALDSEKSLNVKTINGDTLQEIINKIDDELLAKYGLNPHIEDMPNWIVRAKEIERAFDKLLEQQVTLFNYTKIPAQTDVPWSEIEAALELSDWSDEVVRNGFEFFRLDRNLDNYFNDLEGSRNITEQVHETEKDLNIAEIIAILLEDGDLQKAVNKIHKNREKDDPSTLHILGYMFLEYSLRWDVKKLD
jgi:hypothetical protein